MRKGSIFQGYPISMRVRMFHTHLREKPQQALGSWEQRRPASEALVGLVTTAWGMGTENVKDVKLSVVQVVKHVIYSQTISLAASSTNLPMPCFAGNIIKPCFSAFLC